jgi:hypothetical protein
MIGTITLSIELELGWGMHDKGEYGHLSQDRTAETQALNRLLDLADSYDLPITFDVVGHLLHSSCSGHHSGPHPAGWWAEDPGSNSVEAPLFYAPDLIAEIRERPVGHEITTHTYSHLLADEATMGQLDDELSKVSEVHSEHGISAPTTIVMPRHQTPSYTTLSNHGIKTIRTTIEGYTPSFSNLASKLWWLLMRTHPVSDLQTQDSLLETRVTPHPSLTAGSLPAGQLSPHPVFSTIPSTIRQRLHQEYLNGAIELAKNEGKHIHLWTHLYNFSNNSQWDVMKPALARIGQLYNNGEISVQPMRKLSEMVE